MITTPVGAIKTIITDDETGVLIQPANFEQLYQALDVMLTDDVTPARLGDMARRSVQSRYSAKAVTEKYQTLFHQLLKANSV